MWLSIIEADLYDFIGFYYMFYHFHPKCFHKSQKNFSKGKEVRKLSRLYVENTVERTDLYLHALTANDQAAAAEFIVRSKPLDQVGKKLLHSISLVQDDIVWEQPWLRRSSHGFIHPESRLRALETPMRGMKIALNSNNLCLPTGPNSEDMADLLIGVSTFLKLKAEQARRFLYFNSTTVPDLKTDSISKINLPFETILAVYQDLSAGFFLSCAQQFIDDSESKKVGDESVNNKRKQPIDQQKLPSLKFKDFWVSQMRNKRWMFAIKCSLSLFSALLIGLLFNKGQGYWSGLTIAISFVQGRQTVFAVANARAQGTAIGSVYGVLMCFVFRKSHKFRFLGLFPWIIITTFLMHSRMYGQAGGTTAVIGALLILGRNNYTMIPDEFAIIRLTEATIGLCCFLLVELLFKPTRASTMAKKQLYLTISTLHGCIQHVILACTTRESQSSTNLQAFRENTRDLKSQLHDLENFMQEAKREPNFSILAFPSSKYKKLHQSLSSMADVLSCMSYSLDYLLQVSLDQTDQMKEIQKHMQIDLELCKETLLTSLKCLETVSHELLHEKTCRDEEKGDMFPNEMPATWNMETINSGSFRESKAAQDCLNCVEDEGELKGKLLVSLSALGFGARYMVEEVKGIKKVARELIQWEYPSSQL